MASLLQLGVPGASELIVLVIILALLLVIPAAVGYWIARDAEDRGSDHHVAWGLMGFLSGFASWVGVAVFLVFYAVVRDDIGAAPSG